MRGAKIRPEYLNGLMSRDAVYPPFATPVYSNAAFVLLGLALEAILGDGHDYETTLQRDILTPLGMTHTSSHTPPDNSAGIIPVSGSAGLLGSSSTLWDLDLKLGGP